jgi:quercetin dioxygenase-like cupin family protein
MKYFCLKMAAILLCWPLALSAQDPTKAAPDAYKLQLENAWIKVLRVSYAPHSRIPVHDHSRYPAAYIYLSDSGPIHFIHSGWHDPILTRPATKAGSFRLSPTRFEDETHAVENRGDLASEFLRIEIKTEAPNRKSLVGRFAPFTGSRKQGLNNVEFDNSQLRITRIITRPGQPLDVRALSDRPSLIVVIAGAAEYTTGQTVWLAPRGIMTFAAATQNAASSSQIELLRLDFKTDPK